MTAICLCGSVQHKQVTSAVGADGKERRILRCLACDLLSPDPIPSDAELREQYRNYGTYAAKADAVVDVMRKRPQAENIARRVSRHFGADIHGLTLLEPGCAAGALLVSLRELGFNVSGVEVDPASVAVARQRLGDCVHHGPMESLAGGASRFNVIYADQVLEHVLNADVFLSECFKLLKPGGLLWLGTPNFAGISARLLRGHWKEMVPTEHIRMFTPNSLKHYIAAAGFAKFRIWTQGISMVHRSGSGPTEIRRELLPIKIGGFPRKMLAKSLALAGLGDGLSAFAFRD